MERIKDEIRIKEYIKKYNIDRFFSEDPVKYMELILYDKKEYIVRQGEQLQYLYFFLNGKAKVVNPCENGKSLLISFYDKFGVLGDVELMGNGMATMDVQVIEKSYCIAIKKDCVKQNFLSDPKFLISIAMELSNKLTDTSNKGSINQLYPLENRLASYIVNTSEKTWINGKQEFLLSGNLTEISEWLGSSYRHLLRLLKKMIDAEILLKIDSRYMVVNMNYLVEISKDLYS